MRHDEAQKLIDLYLADDPLLHPEERLRLEEHLHECSLCRAEYEQGHQVVSLIRQALQGDIAYG